MYRLICQKPAHFLFIQIVLVSTLFQMFIVLGMYKFVLLVNYLLSKILFTGNFCSGIWPISGQKNCVKRGEAKSG